MESLLALRGAAGHKARRRAGRAILDPAPGMEPAAEPQPAAEYVEPEDPVRLGDRPTGWLHPELTRVLEQNARAHVVQRLTPWLAAGPRGAALEAALALSSPMRFQPDWNEHAASLGAHDATVAMVALDVDRALDDDPRRVIEKVGEFETARAARRTRRSDERRAREFLEALSTPELLALVHLADAAPPGV